jgi:hypothetical protein
MNFHRTSSKRREFVKARHALAAVTHRFAVDGVSSLRANGTGAPSRRRTPFVLTSLAALLALALTATPALAAETHVFKEAFGEAGSGDGQLALAEHSGLAIDQTTHDIYVADPGNGRVDKFDLAGTFIPAFIGGLRAGVSR